MRELTGFQRDLLVVAGSLDRPSGLEIKGELERSQGLSLLSSRVYANLDDLVSMGLIEKSSTDGRTNSYTLTGSGVETVRARYRWLRSHLPIEDAPAEGGTDEQQSYASGQLG